MSVKHFNVIVIGAGPGGSTLATLLSQKGLDVAIVEKESFPRFKIGESLLPHSMDILKESKVFEKLDTGKYIRKYGASFIAHNEAEPLYFEFANGLDNDHQYAFEVPREEFDQDLLNHAKENGVSVFQPESAIVADLSQTPVPIKTTNKEFTCDYLVDASGRNAFLGSQFRSRQANKEFINNIAVFNHYKNVKRHVQRQEGDIIIGVLPDNSWSWHIPFKGDITSIGVVMNPETYKKHKDSPDMVRELLNCHPKFDEIMDEAEATRKQQVVSNYSYGSDSKIGERWIMVGDAATFLDPVFSSGVHLSLTTAKLASEVILEAFKENSNLNSTSSGKDYESTIKLGVDRFQSLLLIFYRTDFIRHMSKVVQSDHLYKSFTSAFSGDMWNEKNFLFRFGVLQDGKVPSENISL